MAMQAGGRQRAQLIHSTSWLSAAKGIPTEISANMEMNLAEWFYTLFAFNGLSASAWGMHTFPWEQLCTRFAGKQAFTMEMASSIALQ